MTYYLQDGSQVVTFIYLRQEDNEKTCKFFSVLTMLETFEIADSSCLAKDESMLEVAGAVVAVVTSSSVDVVMSLNVSKSRVMFSGTVVAMRLASVCLFLQPKVVQLRPNTIL